jgi:hypothetical protein
MAKSSTSILYDGSEGELYNHAEDPHQWRNLWDDPGYAKLKADPSTTCTAICPPPATRSSPSKRRPGEGHPPKRRGRYAVPAPQARRERGDAMSDVLKIRDDGRVRTIVLNRPEKKNALSNELAWGIVTAVEQAAHDDNVWVVAITGTGDSFCS